MPGWARAVLIVAALKIGCGLVLYLSGLVATGAALVPAWLYAAMTSAFALLGGLLVIGARDDPRAVWLGGIFILVATPFTPVVNDFRSATPSPLAYLRPEAFLPSFAWSFLREFPAPISGAGMAWVRVGRAASIVIGAWLALVNLSVPWLLRGAGVDVWREPFLLRRTWYWPLFFGLTLPALVGLLWRSRQSSEPQRTRAQLFVRALLFGVAPFALQVTAEELIPAYKAFSASPPARPVIAVLIFGALATVPFVTTYSVLFDRVVEVRVVVRMALQYALARYTIVALTLIPFAALALFVYEHRTEAIVSLFSGPRPLLLIAAAACGLLALRLRDRWLAAVDRRYFRAPYDAQQILASVVGDLHAHGADDLGDRIKRELERALHTDVEVFFANDARTALRHVGARLAPLAVDATLVDLAASDVRPMDVDLEQPGSAWHRLPEAEKRWLAQGNFRMLVALRSGGAVAGLLVLAAKRSGLSYSTADRHLLAAVAAATSLALDNLRLRSTPASPAEPAARECLECSRLNPADAPRCVCGGEVAVGSAPYVLRGVFRLEQRIGAGGMGVVYRATDLNLGRDVAIKTLPKVTGDYAVRLRKEARAMAAVSHPNLAVVHGIETWQGIPFLVEEYLAGGTLARRLTASRLPILETLSLGITLAEALEQLHAAGILHCDIKPSNIGFTSRGVAKLLDFGLARLLNDARAQADVPTTMKLGAARPSQQSAASVSGAFAGTPHYMCPEAVRGERPGPVYDVWGLSVVLFEAVTGRRPFDGDSAGEIFERIASASRVSALRLMNDCPPAVVDLFARLLSADSGERPTDAGTLHYELRMLRDHRLLG